MIKAFLLILIILPSYLLSDNTDGGFGSIANDRNEPISFLLIPYLSIKKLERVK